MVDQSCEAKENGQEKKERKKDRKVSCQTAFNIYGIKKNCIVKHVQYDNVKGKPATLNN